jgi:hypothetical protein
MSVRAPAFAYYKPKAKLTLYYKVKGAYKPIRKTEEVEMNRTGIQAASDLQSAIIVWVQSDTVKP